MAIVRDTGGSTFPVVTQDGAFAASPTTKVSDAFSTGASSGRIRVKVALGNYAGTDMGVPVLTWTNGTGSGRGAWTKVGEANRASANTHIAQIWECEFTSQQTAQTLTLTWTGSAINWGLLIVVDARTGASATLGQVVPVTMNGGSAALTAAVTGATSGSWIDVCCTQEDAATLAALAGTTEEADWYPGSGIGHGVGINSGHSGGSVSVGWSTATAWGAVIAVEMLEGAAGGGTSNNSETQAASTEASYVLNAVPAPAERRRKTLRGRFQASQTKIPARTRGVVLDDLLAAQGPQTFTSSNSEAQGAATESNDVTRSFTSANSETQGASTEVTTCPGSLVPVQTPLISRGQPTYASTDSVYGSALAIDEDYIFGWQSDAEPTSGTPQWWMIDLGAVSTAQRGQVAFWWGQFGSGNWDYSLRNAGAAYNLPGDYVLRIHPSSSSTPPADSDGAWETVATISGNRVTSRLHTFDLKTYRWIQFRCTAISVDAQVGARTVSLNVDIHSIPDGVESWAFVGDSITGTGHSYDSSQDNYVLPWQPSTSYTAPVENGPFVRNNGRVYKLITAGTSASSGGPTGTAADITDGTAHWRYECESTGAFRQAIALATSDAYEVQDQNCGIPFDTAIGDGLGRVNNVLSKAPNAKYVVIAFGTNDAGGSTPTTYAYYDALVDMVDAVIAAGKIPIVPFICWTGEAPWQANIGPSSGGTTYQLNTQVAKLHTDRPDVLAGPDFWTFFSTHQNLILSGDVHPTWAGYMGIQQIWADWAVAQFYTTSSSVTSSNSETQAASTESNSIGRGSVNAETQAASTEASSVGRGSVNAETQGASTEANTAAVGSFSTNAETQAASTEANALTLALVHAETQGAPTESNTTAVGAFSTNAETQGASTESSTITLTVLSTNAETQAASTEVNSIGRTAAHAETQAASSESNTTAVGAFSTNAETQAASTEQTTLSLTLPHTETQGNSTEQNTASVGGLSTNSETQGARTETNTVSITSLAAHAETQAASTEQTTTTLAVVHADGQGASTESLALEWVARHAETQGAATEENTALVWAVSDTLPPAEWVVARAGTVWTGGPAGASLEANDASPVWVNKP